MSSSDPSDSDLRDLYENAPCGYLSLGPDGKIVRVNATLCNWLGRTSDEMIGKRLRDLLNVAGSIFYETHFAPLLRMQGFFEEVALDLVTPDGKTMPVLANAAEHRISDEVVFTRVTMFRAPQRRRHERELVDARAAEQEARRKLEELCPHLHNSTDGDDGGRLEVELASLRRDAMQLGDEDALVGQRGSGDHRDRLMPVHACAHQRSSDAVEIAQGHVQGGDAVQVFPSGERATVVEVRRAGSSVERAQAGESAGLVLDRQLDVSRGDWIVTPGTQRESRRFDATLAWLDTEAAQIGRRYLVRHGNRWVQARIAAIRHRLDIHTLQPTDAHELAVNDIGEVTVELQQPLPLEPYADNRVGGALIVVDPASHRTSGALLVSEPQAA